MPLSAQERNVVEEIKRLARASSKSKIEAFAAAQQANISAGKDPFDGLEPYAALFDGVLDVVIDTLMEVMKDRVKVETGITVSGGSTTTEGNLKVKV